MLYTVGTVTGKGLGVTARVPIQRGQEVMKERPLIEAPANLRLSSPSQDAANDYFSEKVRKLSAEQQELFYSLSDWRNEQAGLPKSAYCVFRSNALPKGRGRNAQGAAVYQTICRINHSCLPNCHYSWNAGQGCEVVHALSDIPAGDELEVSYIELFASATDRRKTLRAKFGFECACPACSAQGNQLKESNERRVRLGALDREIQACREERPRQAVEGLKEYFRLFAEEGIADTYLSARVYHIALDICHRHPDLGNARDFAQLGLEDFTISEGADGDAASQLRSWLSSETE